MQLLKQSRHAGKKRFLQRFRREKCPALRHQHICGVVKLVNSQWRVVSMTLRAVCWVEAHPMEGDAVVSSRPCSEERARPEVLDGLP